MDSEKKFKLDELPDENSGSSVLPPKKTKIIPKVSDPRLDTLKTMSDQDRVEEMRRRWIFDCPVRLWGWIFYVAILLVLEKSGFYQDYVAQIDLLNRGTMDMGGTMFSSVLLGFDNLVKHPFFLVVLTPFVFKFKKPSDYVFEVNFDGINTVKRINLGEHELPTRVQLKWGDIVEIFKSETRNRPILVLSAASGPVGELIWDIEEENKRAFKLLLQGLIPKNHVLIQFLEKEVT
jgi:hypothetical protein